MGREKETTGQRYLSYGVKERINRPIKARVQWRGPGRVYFSCHEGQVRIVKVPPQWGPVKIPIHHIEFAKEKGKNAKNRS